MISTAIVVFSGLCVLVDTLLGILRGRNRSLLRLGLVVLSAAIAFFAYKPITNIILGIQLDGYSISGTILEMLTDSAINIPESLLNLVIALIQIILGIFVFILTFGVIKFLTWLIVFPILKIFVRPEEKKNRGIGALVGFAQGLLVAIIICGCLCGFLAEGKKIANTKIGEEKLVEIPDNLQMDSPVISFFNVSGGWVFDIVSTTTDPAGRTVSIASICNTAETLLSVTNDITNAYSSLDNLADSEGEMTVETMKNVGDALINVGTAIEELDDDSKALVSDLISDVKDIASSSLGEIPPELETMIDSIDVEDIKIKSAGEALNAIAKYVEEGSVTQEDVDDIVNGIADNMFLVDMLGAGDMTLIDVDDLNEESFKTAIENAGLTQEEMDALLAIFGLN